MNAFWTKLPVMMTNCRYHRSQTPLTKLLLRDSPCKNNTLLKKRLIAQGLLQNNCLHCGIKAEWQGKSLTLEIDHINGDNRDNRLINLRILCPNCHSQTDTFRRPKKSKRIKPEN